MSQKYGATMSTRYVLHLFTALLIFTSACVTAGAPKSASCPSPGTEVPFSKLVTPGFAEDYVGCDISTTAQFVAPGAGAWVLPVPIDGKVVFRVLPPGATGEKNPLSGEIQANFVVIPKEAGNPAFNLKAGDMVHLSGGTYVERATGLGKMYGLGGHTSIVFMANSMAPAP